MIFLMCEIDSHWMKKSHKNNYWDFEVDFQQDGFTFGSLRKRREGTS